MRPSEFEQNEFHKETNTQKHSSKILDCTANNIKIVQNCVLKAIYLGTISHFIIMLIALYAVNKIRFAFIHNSISKHLDLYESSLCFPSCCRVLCMLLQLKIKNSRGCMYNHWTLTHLIHDMTRH